MNSDHTLRRALGATLLLSLVTPSVLAANDELFEDTLVSSDRMNDLFRTVGAGLEIRGNTHAADHEGAATGRPDDHAPIGVMGDHLHAEGEWMVSLRAMRMHMDGMRDGTDSLSSSDVLSRGFMVTPTEMDTDMLMAGAMWAPTDDVTLMAMVPYIDRTMDHVTMNGTEFTTESRGLGDVSLTALVRAWDKDNHHVHFNLGVSIPTGSIDEEDVTPASGGNDVRLPYPMQLGSGTWDLLPGVTYTGHDDVYSWGLQALMRVPIENENSNDYRLGGRGEVSTWLARRLNDDFSTSGRLRYSRVRDINGADPSLNPAMIPTADTSLFGGERVDLFWGVNYIDSDAGPSSSRFAFEVGVPVYQDLDGPQMEMDWVATVAWQKAF